MHRFRHALTSHSILSSTHHVNTHIVTTTGHDPDLKSGGCTSLTDVYNAQSGDGPLYVLDADDNIVDSVPTGRWLLTASLVVEDNVTLFVKGKDRGGDCDVLRIQVLHQTITRAFLQACIRSDEPSRTVTQAIDQTRCSAETEHERRITLHLNQPRR